MQEEEKNLIRQSKIVYESIKTRKGYGWLRSGLYTHMYVLVQYVWNKYKIARKHGGLDQIKGLRRRWWQENWTQKNKICLYRQENRNSVLFVFPSHELVVWNLHTLLKTLISMNGPLGGVNQGTWPIRCLCWLSISPSHDWWRVRTVPPPLSFGRQGVAYLHWVLSIV